VSQGTYHGGKLDKEDYDHGHDGRKLKDFVSYSNSHGSHLSEANALAARIYTTSSYKRLNSPLRFRCSKGDFDHPFKMTVYYLDEGLRQLRTVAAAQSAAQNESREFSKQHRFYRGMKGMEANLHKLKIGGTERALMSTSNKREVAAAYAGALKEEEVCMCVCLRVCNACFKPAVQVLTQKRRDCGPSMIMEYERGGVSTDNTPPCVHAGRL